MPRYEFHDYGPNPDRAQVTYAELPSDASARGKAGTLAKRNGGPVDLARNTEGEWDQRYLTTAMPSEHHASGYRFERIEN